MTAAAVLFDVAVIVLGLGGWVLYTHERTRSRDYASDLAQLIHDYDLTADDLRRSVEWEEIEQRARVERRGADE